MMETNQTYMYAPTYIKFLNTNDILSDIRSQYIKKYPLTTKRYF